MPDDGRWLALGALGILGIAEAVRTRGSRTEAGPRFGPPPKMVEYVRNAVKAVFPEVLSAADYRASKRQAWHELRLTVPVDLTGWKFQRFVQSTPASIDLWIVSDRTLLTRFPLSTTLGNEIAINGGGLGFFVGYGKGYGVTEDSFDTFGPFVYVAPGSVDAVMDSVVHELTHVGQWLLGWKMGTVPRVRRVQVEEPLVHDRAWVDYLGKTEEFWPIVAAGPRTGKTVRDLARELKMIGMPVGRRKRILSQYYRSLDKS